MTPLESIFLEENLLDAFLSDPSLRELWFDGADLGTLKKLAQTGVRAKPVPVEKPSQPVWDLRQNEFVRLTISPDEMSVWLELSPVLKNVLDRDSLFQLLEDELKKAGVVCGIQRRQLNRLAGNPVFGTPVLAAKGMPPKEENTGAQIFQFQPFLAPFPQANGSCGVNPSSPDFVQIVRVGDKLCMRVKNPEDRSGRTVRGARIPPLHPELDHLDVGDNVHLSKDGRTLYSIADGEVHLGEGKISVRPILRLEEVDKASGDIKFPGSVYVTGSVQSGRSIEAGGNVVVGGVVEDCVVSAELHIAVGRGVKGAGSCRIRAGGTLRTPFLENVSAETGGDLYAGVLLSAEVSCEQKICVLGKHGKILGGECAAREISAQEAGADSRVLTKLEILSLKPLQDRLDTLESELKDWERRGAEMRRLSAEAENDIRRKVLERLFLQTEQRRASILAEAENLRTRVFSLSAGCSFTIDIRSAIHPNTSCVILGNLWTCEKYTPGIKLFLGKNGIGSILPS